MDEAPVHARARSDPNRSSLALGPCGTLDRRSRSDRVPVVFAKELARNGLASARQIGWLLARLGPRRSGLCAFDNFPGSGDDIPRSVLFPQNRPRCQYDVLCVALGPKASFRPDRRIARYSFKADDYSR